MTPVEQAADRFVAQAVEQGFPATVTDGVVLLRVAGIIESATPLRSTARAARKKKTASPPQLAASPAPSGVRSSSAPMPNGTLSDAVQQD